jgi:AsmA protein
MGRIVKVLGIVVGAVVVLLIVAGLLIGMFVDPNDYKEEITQAVAEATGRELTLPGELELGIFPSVRIAVGEASLANAQGFGNAPFARIESAVLSVRLLPLFSSRIEVGEARLTGLVLNLGRDAQGRNNWQDLAGEDTAADAAPADASSTAPGSLDLNVAAIEVANAEVNWNDALTGGSWSLQNFDLEATDLGEGSAFPLTMSFNLTGPEVSAGVVANALATLGLSENAYRLTDLEVIIEGSGSGWPGGEGEARVGFDAFDANLNDETLNLENLNLEMLGMQINGTLAGRHLMSRLELNGAIEIGEFDPQELLEMLGTPIETADPDVLRRASASASFSYDPNAMGMSDMVLSLDDSRLSGDVAMNRGQLVFGLDVDSINIDRYLPPAAEEEVEDEGSLDEVDLPIEPLKNFRASGRLAFGETQFMGLSFSDASFRLEARDGRLTITPQASLYGGTYGGRIGLAVNGNAATLTLVQAFHGLDLGPFAHDYLDLDTLTGTMDLNLDVAATGSNLGEMRRALDGDVSFAFTDGSWEGFDTFYELRRARAVFDSQDVPPRPAGDRRTPFESIAATGVVEDAILTNNDFSARLPFMALEGGGTVNLLTDEIAFEFNTRFIDGPMLQEDPLMAGLADAQLPLDVTGTLAAPSIRPDFGALVRARVQEEVRDAIEEESENLRERVRDRLRGLLE